MPVIQDPNSIPRTPGTYTGVIGGIPTDRTNIINAVTEGVDNTGATSAGLDIQALINAASSGDIIYLPAGTYKIDDAILSFGPARSGITLRGDGTSTILDLHAGAGVFVGSQPGASDYSWATEQYADPSTNNTVTAGLTAGSTTLTIADTSAFSVGDLIQIALYNQTDNTEITNGAVVVIHTLGFERLRRQMTRVTAKTGTTLTIFPPVHYTPESNLTAKINRQSTITTGVGIEDLVVDSTNNSAVHMLEFQAAYGCWIKGVKVVQPENYGITFQDVLNCEIRKSYVSTAKTEGYSNHAGMLLNHAVNCLIVDNIVEFNWPTIEVNESTQGTVFVGNFLLSGVAGSSVIEHGSHPSFNLWEGNVFSALQQDGYFSSASQTTLYRNWITGTLYVDYGGVARDTSDTPTISSDPESWTNTINLARFTRKYAGIGNILGTPDWYNNLYATSHSLGVAYSFAGSSVGTTQPTDGTFWSDWKTTGELTTRTSDGAGVITVDQIGTTSEGELFYFRTGSGTTMAIYGCTVSSAPTGLNVPITTAQVLPALNTVGDVFTGPGGYEERDLDVFETYHATTPGSTYLIGNCYAWTAGGNGIPADESLGANTLADSLAYDAKPDWYGSLTWPSFNPSSPGTITRAGWTRIPAGYRYVNGNENYLSGDNTITISGTVTPATIAF